MEIENLIVPLGITTFTLLWTTAFLGLNFWKLHLIKTKSWHHFLFAGLTLLSATCHMSIVLITNLTGVHHH